MHRGDLRLIQAKHRLGTFGSYSEIFNQATGEFICQLDADDSLYPDSLASCLAKISANPEMVLIYTDCMKINETGDDIELDTRSQRSITDHSLLYEFSVFHLRLIRLTAYRRVGGYSKELM